MSRAVVAEERHHVVHLGGPEAGHHLIEQEDARARGQCAGDLQAFALRQRQRGRHLVALGREAQLLDDLRSFLLGLAHAGAGIERADDDVLHHR